MSGRITGWDWLSGPERSLGLNITGGPEAPPSLTELAYLKGEMAYVSSAKIVELLPREQTALREQEGLDKAEWMLLVEAFYEGFHWGLRESDAGLRGSWLP